jgi:hypothetical protein
MENQKKEMSVKMVKEKGTVTEERKMTNLVKAMEKVLDLEKEEEKVIIELLEKNHK